jgi:hypothetical protein
MSNSTKTAERIVALFNTSNETVGMIRTILKETGDNQSLVWCHFADFKRGIVDFATYLTKYNPELVIVNVSAPYEENWQFFKTIRGSDVMRGRGLVLMTPNKARLDEVSGTDSHALVVQS